MYGNYYHHYPVMGPYTPMQDPTVRKESNKPSMHPIAQPFYVNQAPATYTNIHQVEKIPQPNQYVTCVEPVFLDHLSRHQGLDITVQTTAKEVKGKLAGVAVDHIEIKLSKNKAVHIRLDQIVCFEGLPL